MEADGNGAILQINGSAFTVTTNKQDRLPRYNVGKSYSWNYDHAPDRIELDIPKLNGSWDFCGLPVDSPLGVPAGPLLNGRWCLYYADLGFDVVTYKTVRSSQRDCYPLPNLQPVRCGQLYGGEQMIPAAESMHGSWAVSFGMPSKSPDVWRADIQWTREQLPKGKLLSVSVVGTVEPDWSIDELAADYALCARWAVESGADCVETNFSCPNVSTCDGQLFQQPQNAQIVAAHVRAEIGDVPYIVKIGQVSTSEQAAALLEALASHVDALSMTNSVAATVQDDRGALLFDGQPRGICGAAVLEASLGQTSVFAQANRRLGTNVKMIGVGGASRTQDIRRYLSAGAHAVHIASAAMTQPDIARRIKCELSELTVS